MATGIVASVMPRDAAELRQLRDQAGGLADLFEVRADLWTGSGDELAIAIAQLERSVIVSARPAWQGGAFAGSEVDRVTLLRAAARTASHIDIELRAAFATIAFAPAKKIVSTHDFEGMPADLERTVAELRNAAPDVAIVKLAVTPRSLADVASLARLQRLHAGATPPLVAIGMGELGIPTRVLAGRLGAPLVYGHVPAAGPTGPGQLDVGELASTYRVRSQRPSTAVCAIVGNPVSQSLSPRLHNALLAHLGIDRVFVPLLADTLDEALHAADELGIDGLSVTQPFKEAAARVACGAIAGFPFPPPEGAVNTLMRSEAGWLAANTDRDGFIAALERGAPELLRGGRSALVLGAGGAARTAVAVLVGRGMRVTVASRTRPRAEAVARAFGAKAVAIERLDAARFHLVVNATPLGMIAHANESPLPEGALRSEQTVFDLVYRPRRTKLLAQAEAAGARALGGVDMFVAQALAQFAIFTGRAGDEALARAIVESALGPVP